MMRVTLFCCVFLLLAIGCKRKEPVHEKKETIKDRQSERQEPELNVEPSNEIEGSWQRIQYPEFTFLVEPIEMGWDAQYVSDNDSICVVKGDTAEFDMYPGNWFYDSELRIEQDEFEIVDLFVLATCKVAMNSEKLREVPLCVLEDWKQTNSGWLSLEPIEGRTEFYFPEDTTINFDIDYSRYGFKTAVLTNCGEDWFDEVKDRTPDEDLLDSLFVTDYLFRVRVRNKETGVISTKFLRFYTPQSC